MRGGYGRPLTSTIFRLVFVCRVTGTLRTTLCSGGRLLPPQVLFHTHVFVPQVSLSLGLFVSLSLSAWPLGPAFRNWSCQTLTSNCTQNALEECTEHKNPGNYFFVWKGDMLCCFLATLFRKSTRLFLPISSFVGQSNRGFQIEDFSRLLCVSERGNAVRFCRGRFPRLSRKVRPHGDGIFCDIRGLDF